MPRRLQAYPMILLLLPLVVAIVLFDRFYPKPQPPEEPQKYGFVVVGAPKATAKCERFETRELGIRELGFRELGIGDPKVFLYLLRDSTKNLPSYGDTIVATTQIEWNRQYGRAFAARYLILPAKEHKTPLQIRLYGRLADAGLSGDELATVGALTLGYKDDIDPEVKRHFQASGAAHVLAVSGLHTGIIYGLLVWLQTLGGRIRPMHENKWGRRAISAVIIAVMWGYAWLTGMTPSVVRAVLMVSLFEIGRMFYRQSFSLNTIAAAAVLILLVKPSDLWSVSFQLSFAATAAIVVMVNGMGKVFHYRELRQTFAGRVINWVIALMLVSIAAQLGTLPISIYYFGQVSSYFLLTNLIVLPLASVLVPCGLATIALGGSWLGVLVGKVTWALSWAMNHSVGRIESLPGSTIPAHASGGMVLLYYVLLLLFCTFLSKKYN